VRETRRQAIDFYRGLVQDLKAWQAPAPKLPPEEAREEPGEAQPEPPPFSDAPRSAILARGRTSPPFRARRLDAPRAQEALAV
jgi:hypothetical protein